MITELEVKNETIISLNLISADIGHMNRGLKTLYSKEFTNSAEIYKEKMFELEDLLKQNGMTFYTDNILGAIVLHYFDEVLEESYKPFNKISDNFTDFPNNYILQRVVLLCNLKYVLQYESICRKFQSFSLNDISKCAYKFFKSRVFYNYSPNWFYKTYEVLLKILIKLGIDYGEMDLDVIPIIEKQEKDIKNLYECAIEQTGSTEEADIRNYIDKFVKEIKNEIHGRQKIRN